jgi:hypothetical protein
MDLRERQVCRQKAAELHAQLDAIVLLILLVDGNPCPKTAGCRDGLCFLLGEVETALTDLQVKAMQMLSEGN